MNLPQSLRPFLAAILAPWITLLLAWVAGKTGVVYDAEAQQTILMTFVAFVFALLASASAVIKIWINKRVNPGNAASAPLAEAQKAQAETLEQAQDAG